MDWFTVISILGLALSGYAILNTKDEKEMDQITLLKFEEMTQYFEDFEIQGLCDGVTIARSNGIIVNVQTKVPFTSFDKESTYVYVENYTDLVVTIRVIKYLESKY